MGEHFAPGNRLHIATDEASFWGVVSELHGGWGNPEFYLVSCSAQLSSAQQVVLHTSTLTPIRKQDQEVACKKLCI